MNSVKIINNYSIIKQRKQNNTKISKTNTQVFTIKKIHKFYFYTISTSQNIKQNYK